MAQLFSHAASFTVTTTNLTGAGSLRQAILNANAAVGDDVIDFNIPAGGLTISLTNSLPAITEAVTIDGTTQPGFAGSPIIELNGQNAGAGVDGLKLSAGNSTIRGLVINRFNGDGIEISTNGNNVVEGNIIGLDVAGITDLGNNQNGIFITNSANNTIGGTTTAERNFISGNTQNGINVTGTNATNNLVVGNVIGLSVTNAARANSNGIFVNGAPNNIIGGTTASARNVISGNTSDGIEISGTNATGNVIQGNYIGSDPTGTLDLGNSADGVLVTGAPGNIIGGTAAGAGNLISGNNNDGIELTGTGSALNQVLGNRIGTTAAGNAALANGVHGVQITSNARTNFIGGVAAGAGNVIAFNGQDGVYVNAGTNNAIRANTIFSNGGATAANLGIDLGTSGVTTNDVNDVDTGANQLQNFPILTAATANTNNTVIQGTLNSLANTTFQLDFFANRAPDASGNGEGQQYLGSGDMTTDASSNGVFNVTVPGVITGRYITATATDPDGNTSEFSPALVSVSTIPGSTFTVTTTNDSGAGSLRQAILDNNLAVNGPNNLIQFAIGGAGPHMISPGTALPAITEPVTIDGYTQSGASVNTLANGDNAVIQIRLDGVSAGGGSEGLTLQATGCIVRGLSVTRFSGEGILISGGNTLVEGNFIGLDVDGTNGLPNSANGILINGVGNTIGGTTLAARNLISGNNSSGNDGVEINGAGASNNVVAGNYIGPDKSGTLDRGNGQDGVFVTGAPNNTIGGANASARNLISGNNSEGVTISGNGATGNQLLNNYIGTDATGTLALGNSVHGVQFVTGNPSGNTVGSVNPGGNVIAFNGQDGVYVNAGTNNAIRANTIFSNGGATAANLGIDLGTSGVTTNDVNDVDTGANQLQNFPILTAATANTNNTVIQGTLNSRANTTFQLDFFANRAPDASGNGEGQQYLGSGDVTTDASSNGVFNVTVPGVIIGRFITATATDPDGNTSEFSPALVSVSTIPGSTFIVTTTNDNGAGSLRQAILDNNAAVNGPNNLIQFAIGGAGPHVISPATALPAITEPVTIDGYTQSGASVNTLANGNNAVLRIRLDGAGIAAFGTDGLRLTSRGNVIRGLSITRFSGEGIETGTNGVNAIEGNFIGLDANGVTNLANSSYGVYLNASPGNTVGGTTPAARNLISGNNNSGVQITGANATANVVVGNFIGTDASGTLDRGNGGDGVTVQDAGTNTVGGASAGARNLISGNSSSGVEIVQFSGTSTANQILGNFIGSDVTGTNDLGNSQEGVLISATGNIIGAIAVGAANLIAFNDSHGIRVSSGTNNVIQANTIRDNTILGIDLGFDFNVTANDDGDPDTGANQLQNFPIISAATITPANTTIAGSLNSQPNTAYTIDFFASVFRDSSGNGEGQQYLGSAGMNTDANSNGVFNVTLPAVAIGRQITATATDPFGNTSEFSPAFAALSTFPPQSFTVLNTNDSGAGSLRQAILNNNATASGGNNTIAFSISGAGPHTIAPLTPLPAFTESATLDGYTQAGASTNTLANGFNANLRIRLEGTNLQFNFTPVLRLNSSSNVARGLVIVRFGGSGIEAASAGNILEGNVIGLDLDGTDLGNSSSGILVSGPANRIGGTGSGARNVISGNSGDGIFVNGSGASGNVIQGNFIGTDLAGALDRGNANGINLGSSSNIVGGAVAGARNVISGNSAGVTVNFSTVGNIIQGNFIGTDVAGTNRLGNSASGVGVFGATNTVIGGTAAGVGNLISGNFQDGVRITSAANGTVVQGNRIGTDVTGALPVANSGNGVAMDITSANTVGGIAAGAANVIAFNSRGVAIAGSSATNNSVRANSIFSNNSLGIDLGAFFSDGVTTNDVGDADAGGNLLQNFPVLTNAVANTNSTIVQGTLNSLANTTFQLDFYSNPDRDSSNHGEGKTWLGTAPVTTDGSGNGVFNVTLPVKIVGRCIAATATDPNGNTSEFSESFTPVYNLPPRTFIVRNTNDSGPESLRQALLDVDLEGASGNDVIAFDIPGSGVRTIQPLSALPEPQDPVTIDGFTQPGASANTLAAGNNAVWLIRLDGTNVNFTSGLVLTNAGNVIRGLEISQFNAYGIEITGGVGNVVEGCLISFNDFGGVAITDSPGNRIGGTAPAARNVISANGFNGGVAVQGAGSVSNVVQGNFIGTDPTGSADLGNQGAGVEIENASTNTVGGATAAARNVISGNNGAGVLITGFGGNAPTGNRILGNYIGPDATGSVGVTNSVAGISISSGAGTIIGGTGAGEGNLIAFNAGDGVQIFSGASNHVIRANSIFNNGGLTSGNVGIDLFGFNGVTANDAGDGDTGANLLQNFPVLTNAVLTASNLVVQGTLNSRPSAAYQVDFYSNLECDPSGNGEGRFWLGAAAVNTGADSNAVINTSLPLPVQGHFITATATDADGNTSEFCACRQVISGIPPLNLTVVNTNDTGPGSLRQAILDNNNSFTATNNLISFNIPGSGLRIITPASPLPDITAPVTMDGYTQPGASPNTSTNFTNNAVVLVRLDGINAGTNDVDGLRLVSSNNVVSGLNIVRFSGDGIELIGPANLIDGNFIGFDAGAPAQALAPARLVEKASDGRRIIRAADSGLDFGNGGNGARILSGNNRFAWNISSGNMLHGVVCDGFDAFENDITWNVFGGTARLTPCPNVGNGAGLIQAPDNRVWKNFICYNRCNGVEVFGSGASGNYIGANKISFNEKDGVFADDVFGLSIGAPGRADTIEDNLQYGVRLVGGFVNDFRAGFVRRNGLGGVRFTGDASGNRIGGDLPGEGVTFQNNGGSAEVVFDGGSGNIAAGGNRFQDNLGTRKPVDLQNNANGGVGTPTIDNINVQPNQVVLSMTVPSGTSQVEVFCDADPNSTRSPQGLFFVSPDPNGRASVTVPGSGGAGFFYSVAAITSFGSTELSVPVRAGGAPAEADLAVNVTGAANGVAPGLFEYNATIQNLSPNPATGVDVVSTFPANTLFRAGPGTAIGGNQVIWPVGSLSAGESTSRRFTYFAPNPAMVNNQFVVRAAQADPNTANNSSSVLTQFNPLAQPLTDVPFPAPQLNFEQDPMEIVQLGGNNSMGSVKIVFDRPVQVLPPLGASSTDSGSFLFFYNLTDDGGMTWQPKEGQNSGAMLFDTVGTEGTMVYDVIQISPGLPFPGGSPNLMIRISADPAMPSKGWIIQNNTVINRETIKGCLGLKLQVSNNGGSTWNTVAQAVNVYVQHALDFGDTPDGPLEPNYPTRLARDGARHALGGSGPFLGPKVDPDLDPQPNNVATWDDEGDSNDDEDGITFTTPLIPGANAQLTAVASTSARLDAWMDFNADGDWDDVGERIFNNQALALGVNNLSFPVPASATLGNTFARFRISRTGGLNYFGFAPDGEVEDYLVRIGAISFDGVTLEGGQVKIRWTGNLILQCAPAVTGTWNDVPNATSPFSVNPGTDPAGFYRLKSN